MVIREEREKKGKLVQEKKSKAGEEEKGGGAGGGTQAVDVPSRACTSAWMMRIDTRMPTR